MLECPFVLKVDLLSRLLTVVLFWALNFALLLRTGSSGHFLSQTQRPQCLNMLLPLFPGDWAASNATKALAAQRD